MGDWSARVLLLAKDSYPSRCVLKRIADGEARPYSDGPKCKTNLVLARLVEPIAQLGLLCGSALANLLRDDGRLSGSLPNRAEAL